ncbi:MAG: hypothetical protein CMH79_04285 [Nitrospinae bacterium]|nr:hypothetical protein [Nitrospinota bacterium]|tara:strand:+ start:42 stop:314 length:273 start_codon:yes stop_codon:yes gene_type:complete
MSKVFDSVSNLLNEKLVQVALVGAILYYILASPTVFDLVKGMLDKVFGLVGITLELDGMKLVLFHSVVFGLLLYLSAKYLLGPVVGLLKK